MLRLQPTTLSLTMTEVKDFERHLRFKKYLAKDNTFGHLPIRTKKTTPTAQVSKESMHSSTSQPNSESIQKGSQAADNKDSPRLLKCPPRRMPKSGGDSAESSSQGIPSSSQSRTSGSANTTDPTGWGNLPMTLPPPFSRDKRTVSDAQSLPSVRHCHSLRDSTELTIQIDSIWYSDASSPWRCRSRASCNPPRRSSLRATQDEASSSSLVSWTVSRRYSP